MPEKLAGDSEGQLKLIETFSHFWLTHADSGGATNATSPELMKLTSMVWRWCHEGGVITDNDMLDSTIAGFRALDPMDALEFYHLMATDAPAVARHAMEWHTARLREQTAPQVDTAMKVAPDVSPPIAAPSSRSLQKVSARSRSSSRRDSTTR